MASCVNLAPHRSNCQRTQLFCPQGNCNTRLRLCLQTVCNPHCSRWSSKSVRAEHRFRPSLFTARDTSGMHKLPAREMWPWAMLEHLLPSLQRYAHTERDPWNKQGSICSPATRVVMLPHLRLVLSMSSFRLTSQNLDIISHVMGYQCEVRIWISSPM
jgi:hypothetical protein